MADTLALSVILGGALGAGFKHTFDRAESKIGRLGQELGKTRAQAKKVAGYETLETTLGKTRLRLQRARTEALQLRKELGHGPDNTKLGKKLAHVQKQSLKLSATLEKQKEHLRQDGMALRAAGIDTNRLADESDRLKAAVTRQTHAWQRQNMVLDKRKRVGAAFMGQVAKLGSTLLAAHTLAGWTQTSAIFDRSLQDIGNNANLTARQVKALKADILAASKATGQSADTILEGVSNLVAAGLSPQTAIASIRAIGRTAVGESAQIHDLSDATVALINNLKVKPAGLQGALDILTQSGKEGNVELRDMAKQLPSLSASFAGVLKMTGPQAIASLGAALEVARKGTGDADAAANNLNNFLQKVMSPQTLKNAKKNFGIDLYAIIQHAQQTGGNPFEASVQAIMKATHGDAKALGKLFQDMQVQQFLRPMMQHWKEYERIKQSALGAHGVVDKDFERMAATTPQRLAEIGQAWGRLKKQVGTAIGNVFVQLFGWLKPVLNVVGNLVGRFPNLTVGVLAAAGAFASWKAVMLGGQWLTTFLPGMGKLGTLVRALVPGAGLASKAIGGMTLAMNAFNLSMLANPLTWIIGGTIAAVAVGALVIRKYWQPIKAFFTGMWKSISNAAGPVLTSIGKALKPLKPLWDSYVSILKKVWGWFGNLLTPIKSTQSQLTRATSAGVAFGKAWVSAFKIVFFPIRMVIKLVGWLGTAIGNAVGWIVVNTGKAAGVVSSAWNGSINFVLGLWDGLKAKVQVVVGWVAKKIEWISKKWQAVKGTVGKVWSGTKNTIGSAWHKVTHVFSNDNAPSPRTAAAAAMIAAATAASPAMAAKAPVTYHDTSNNTTHITVQAAPGMDERALAKHVRDQLDERDRELAARKRSTLGDID